MTDGEYVGRNLPTSHVSTRVVSMLREISRHPRNHGLEPQSIVLRLWPGGRHISQIPATSQTVGEIFHRERFASHTIYEPDRLMEFQRNSTFRLQILRPLESAGSSEPR